MWLDPDFSSSVHSSYILILSDDHQAVDMAFHAKVSMSYELVRIVENENCDGSLAIDINISPILSL